MARGTRLIRALGACLNMKFIFEAILISILLASSCPAVAKEWRGIVPLHSTRRDVERLLGPPRIDRTEVVFYTIGDEEIVITFSRGSCTANRGGWNAPHNTVLHISIEPKRRVNFTDLKLDLSKYKKVNDPEIKHLVYYNNDKEGISYQVDTGKGTAIDITYYPASSEGNLRCPDSYNDLYNTVKVDGYSKIPFSAEKKRLDAFAQKLFRYDTALGYIMVYAGKRAYMNEAQIWGNRSKQYLEKRWGGDPRRIIFIDGGYREKFTVELFLVPYGLTPPASTPTMRGDEMQIIKS
jgi:hypothetical protein